jgi:hypothetical protein
MPGKVFTSGSIAACGPGYGGHATAVLQFVLGFARLGFDSYYVEELRPDRCRDGGGGHAALSCSANAAYFRSVMARFGLTERSALLDPGGTDHVGLSRHDLEDLAPAVDLLVNRSGHLQTLSILERVRRRVYLDVDPGYTQVWQTQYGVDMHLRGHDAYVTVGLNLDSPDCPFPTCGIRWQRTLPPVVMAEWATFDPPALPAAPWTTIADWRAFGEIEWQGRRYGQKADVFRRYLDLPEATGAPLELCLLVHPAEPDRRALERHGWRLASPCDRAATPDAYREYVTGSRGVFSVAKEAYAAGRTGWWSDRSSCYLAAGRPVIVEDTGFGGSLPTGEGILTFRDFGGAVAAIERSTNDYARNATAAREIAREYLDSDRVLTRLCEVAGV